MSGWCDTDKEKVQALWADGLTASQIGAEIGRTRNAVLGLLHRLDAPTRAKDVRQPIRRNSHAGNIVSRAVKMRRDFERMAAPVDQIDQDAVAVLERMMTEPTPETRVDILHLTARTCRWPYGDARHGTAMYCGAETDHGRVYCPWHGRMAYVPPAERKKAELGIARVAARAGHGGAR